jgi:pimeloyl-ACP methyl ester carboxylesterase
VNRRYFANYDHVTLSGYGHYPMLEAPELFNTALRTELSTLGTSVISR